MAEAVSCEPGDLMAAAKCFRCIPPGGTGDAITWLLAAVSNSTQDPSELIDNASALCCAGGMEGDILIYLLTQLLELSEAESQPNALLADAKCLDCIPEGMKDEVIAYLLNEILGTGLTPSEIANQAKCTKCIPPGKQPATWAWMIYVMRQNQIQLEQFVPPPGFVEDTNVPAGQEWKGPSPQPLLGFGYNPSSAIIEWSEVGGGPLKHGTLDYFNSTANYNLVNQIYINGTAVNNIWGLNLLPALEFLNLSNNKLDFVDLSGCAALKIVFLSDNPMTTITINPASPAPLLEILVARNCHLFTISSLIGCPNLGKLDLHNSLYTAALTLTGTTALQYLDLGSDDPDLFGNPPGGPLAAIDVTPYTNLTYLDLRNNHAIAALDVSLNTVLEHLDIGHLALASLNITGLTLLEYLDCSHQSTNPFTFTWLTHPALETFKCASNHLSGQLSYSGKANLVYIDVSGCDNQVLLDVKFHPAIEYVDFSNTSVNSFTFDQPSTVKTLKCRATGITSLDYPKFPVLEWLDAGGNVFTGDQNLTTCPNLSVVYFDSCALITDVLVYSLGGFNNSITFIDISANSIIAGSNIEGAVATIQSLVSFAAINCGNLNPPHFYYKILRFLNLGGCGVNSAATINEYLVGLNTYHHAGGPIGTVYLNGGSNAAPTGSGLSAKTSLISKGWYVITN